MTGVDSYSTTPATNATDTGGSVNWAEGQAPSTVNNSARQLIADLRSAFNDLIWFQYGTGDQGAGNIAVPSVYASATSFTIAGADVTSVYHAGRRVRAVGSATGTIYGSISSSSYNGGNTTTTVNVTWDSGSLSNETLVVSLSQIPVTGTPLGKSGSLTLTGTLAVTSSATASQFKGPAASTGSATITQNVASTIINTTGYADGLYFFRASNGTAVGIIGTFAVFGGTLTGVMMLVNASLGTTSIAASGANIQITTNLGTSSWTYFWTPLQ